MDETRQVAVVEMNCNSNAFPPWVTRQLANSVISPIQKQSSKGVIEEVSENTPTLVTIEEKNKRVFNEKVSASRLVKGTEKEVALLREARELVPKEMPQYTKLSKLITKKEVALLQALVAEKEELTEEDDQDDESADGQEPDGHVSDLDGFQFHRKSGSYRLEQEFRLKASVFEKLFDYQRRGIKWMWELYSNERPGGVLGDDMGMGKTVQVASFLRGMFKADLAYTVLILAPKSVLVNWQKELRKWGKLECLEYSGTKTQRRRALEYVSESGGVLVTTYAMATQNQALLEEPLDEEGMWDYLILDEGHLIKNTSTKRAKAIRRIRAANKLVLTGTPILNKLTELHALFDFAVPGLLGSAAAFKRDWNDPIVKSSHKSASEKRRAIGKARLEKLKEIIAPYFLRRTKADEPNLQLNARKNDLIVWVGLSETQIRLYDTFLNNKEVREVLNTSKSPLAAVTILKKICQHPSLLHENLTTLDNAFLKELKSLRGASLQDHTAVSGKLDFMMQLLRELVSKGHRVLIFSQWVKMLDIIEGVLEKNHMRSYRIDGTVSKASDRQHLVNKFNRPGCQVPVFLLSTAVGGLGINLTSADRAIIFDPAWNLIDDQAVDRIYRIGQKNNCVVYRLITCGTIEEKIYKKQVFKGSLIRMVASGNAGGNDKSSNNAVGDESYRYFTAKELQDLFTLGTTSNSETQKTLERMHAHKRVTDEELDDHLNFLKTIPNFHGISDHDLVYSAIQDSQQESPLNISDDTRLEAELMTMQAVENIKKGGTRQANVPFTSKAQRLSLLLDQLDLHGDSMPLSMKKEIAQLGQQLFGTKETKRDSFVVSDDEGITLEDESLDDEELEDASYGGSFVVPDNEVEHSFASSEEQSSIREKPQEIFPRRLVRVSSGDEAGDSLKLYDSLGMSHNSLVGDVSEKVLSIDYTSEGEEGNSIFSPGSDFHNDDSLGGSIVLYDSEEGEENLETAHFGTPIGPREENNLFDSEEEWKRQPAAPPADINTPAVVEDESVDEGELEEEQLVQPTVTGPKIPLPETLQQLASDETEAVPVPVPASPAHAPSCAVCMEAAISSVFLPCAHSCTCFGCAQKVKQCPMCRDHFTSAIQIFIG